MTALGMTMVFLFLKSRLSRRRTALIFAGATVLMMALQIVLTYSFSVDLVARLYSLIVHLPSFLVAALLSQYRGWRLLYQVLSAVLFCFLVQHISGIVYYLSHQRAWVLWLTLFILTPLALWLLHRYLCPLVFRVLDELQRGWALICMSLILYGLIVIYIFPGYVGINTVTTVVKPMFSLLMVGFYCVLVLLFTSVRREAEARYHTQLTELSLSALQSRMETVRAAEDIIRTERHDLRHRLLTAMELVSRGDKTSALEFLDAARKRLDDHKEIHWCRPPVLDAVFSSYLGQARTQGILVEAGIALPDPLPVDEGELAIVLANALENAIHACQRLPAGERRISCKVIARPSLMIEIANPVAGAVEFDSRGLPVVTGAGHGLGTRSIAAFCQKYGFLYHFEARDGWFRLRLVL